MEEHKEHVIREAEKVMEIRKAKRRISFFEFTVCQAKYMGKEMALWPALTTVVVSVMMKGSFSFYVDYVMQRKTLPLLFAGLGIFLVMAAVPILARTFRYKMYEIEQSCRMSFLKLITANLIVLAAECSIIFSFCAVIAQKSFRLPFINAAAYFLFPFLLSGTGCIYIFKNICTARERERCSSVHKPGSRKLKLPDMYMQADVQTGVEICEGFCVCIFIVLFILFRRTPQVYERIGGWLALSICLTFAFAGKVFRWIKGGEYEIRNM